MSKYSDFRLENLVYRYATDDEERGHYCRIKGVDRENETYTLRSVTTGEYFNDKLDAFEPNRFSCDDWGFNEGPRKYYTNAELLLYDYKEFAGFVGGGYITEVINGLKETFEIDGVPTFHQAGFQVKKLGSEDWLIDGSERDDEEDLFVGLRYVHEYQNIYNDEFPDIKLDLDTYLRQQLKYRS